MIQTHLLLLTRVILSDIYMCIIITKALKLYKKLFPSFPPVSRSKDYIRMLHFPMLESNLSFHKCATVLVGNGYSCCQIFSAQRSVIGIENEKFRGVSTSDKWVFPGVESRMLKIEAYHNRQKRNRGMIYIRAGTQT